MPTLVEKPKSYETFELKPHDQKGEEKFLQKHQQGDLIYKRANGTIGTFKVTRKPPEGAGILAKLCNSILNFFTKWSFWLESRLSNKPLEGRVTFLTDKETKELLENLSKRISSAATQALPQPKDKEPNSEPEIANPALPVIPASVRAAGTPEAMQKFLADSEKQRAKRHEAEVDAALQMIRTRETAEAAQTLPPQDAVNVGSTPVPAKTPKAEVAPQSATPPQQVKAVPTTEGSVKGDNIGSKIAQPETPHFSTRSERRQQEEAAAKDHAFLRQLSPELRTEVLDQRSKRREALELEVLGHKALSAMQQIEVDKELNKTKRAEAHDQELQAIDQDELAREQQEDQEMLDLFRELQELEKPAIAAMRSIRQGESDRALKQKQLIEKAGEPQSAPVPQKPSPALADDQSEIEVKLSPEEQSELDEKMKRYRASTKDVTLDPFELFSGIDDAEEAAPLVLNQPAQ